MANLIQILTILTTIILLPKNFSTVTTNVSAQDLAIHHPDHPKLAKFSNNQHKLNEGDDSGRTPIKRADVPYVVQLTIGKDPQTQVYVIFDTGSHFTWVQHSSCDPCVAPEYPVTSQYNGSNTLKYFSCETVTDCAGRYDIPELKCRNQSCAYGVGYFDGTHSSGKVGTEILSAFTDTDTDTEVTFVLGVGFDNTCQPTADSCFQGSSGFGPGPLSLPRQLHLSVWGFCLPFNSSMDGSFFKDGGRLPPNFRSTRIYNDGSDYYTANLSAIFVYGGGDFVSAPNNTMVLIDTGTALTYLQDFLFDQLIKSVKISIAQLYDQAPIDPPVDPNKLCYAYPHLLEITIQLGEELFFSIGDSDTAWYPYNETTYCLTFRRNSEEEDLNVIGNMHIKGYMIVYDVTDPDHMYLNASHTPLDYDEGGKCLRPI